MPEDSQTRSAFDLSDKVAIVTGGARGLGEAIAGALTLHGSRTTLVDIDGEMARETAERISRRCGGCSVESIACDVQDGEQVQRVVSQVFDQDGRIDVLVNNAGIHRRHSPEDFPREDIDAVLNVNLLGSFFFARAVGKVMIEQRNGSIINMSAVGGGVAGLGRGGSIYGVSKGGIVALTRDLAAEWGKYTIRVNAIAPGWIRTPMTAALQNDQRRAAKVMERIPLGRWGEAADVASVAVFLASDAAAYITGHTVPVDGGVTNTIMLEPEESS